MTRTIFAGSGGGRPNRAVGIKSDWWPERCYRRTRRPCVVANTPSARVTRTLQPFYIRLLRLIFNVTQTKKCFTAPILSSIILAQFSVLKATNDGTNIYKKEDISALHEQDMKYVHSHEWPAIFWSREAAFLKCAFRERLLPDYLHRST